jgi:Domain of unknown function (DUF4419)
MHEFAVDAVAVDEYQLSRLFLVPMEEAWAVGLKSIRRPLPGTKDLAWQLPLELMWQASGDPQGRYLRAGSHALLEGVCQAWSKHLPLSLSPSAIWSVVLGGVTAWIKAHAEALRTQWVTHEGQLHLSIEVPPRGVPWDEVIQVLTEIMRGHILEDRQALLLDSSSTAGPNEVVANCVQVMDAMSSYFTYGCTTKCGFPRIRLEGEPEDWLGILSRFQGIHALAKEAGGAALEDFQVWADALLPVLDQFLAAVQGQPDLSFWTSFYSFNGMSGGPFISGHILKFFPYVAEKPNPYLREDYQAYYGPTMEDLGSSVSAVDLTWTRYGVKIPLKLHGGLIAVELTPDNYVRPVMGWNVIADRIQP